FNRSGLDDAKDKLTHAGVHIETAEVDATRFSTIEIRAAAFITMHALARAAVADDQLRAATTATKKACHQRGTNARSTRTGLGMPLAVLGEHHLDPLEDIAWDVAIVMLVQQDGSVPSDFACNSSTNRAVFLNGRDLLRATVDIRTGVDRIREHSIEPG